MQYTGLLQSSQHHSPQLWRLHPQTAHGQHVLDARLSGTRHRPIRARSRESLDKYPPTSQPKVDPIDFPPSTRFRWNQGQLGDTWPQRGESLVERRRVCLISRLVAHKRPRQNRQDARGHFFFPPHGGICIRHAPSARQTLHSSVQPSSTANLASEASLNIPQGR